MTHKTPTADFSLLQEKRIYVILRNTAPNREPEPPARPEMLAVSCFFKPILNSECTKSFNGKWQWQKISQEIHWSNFSLLCSLHLGKQHGLLIFISVERIEDFCNPIPVQYFHLLRLHDKRRSAKTRQLVLTSLLRSIYISA